MSLHGFASRSPKSIVFNPKTLLLKKNDSVVFSKQRGVFFGWFRPHLEPLRHDGHVHVPTFVEISHILVPKFTF